MPSGAGPVRALPAIGSGGGVDTLFARIAGLDRIRSFRAAPTHTLLHEHRLSAHEYGAPSGPVPVMDAWALVDHAAGSQRSWDFGFRLANVVTVQRASCGGPPVAAAPTQLASRLHVD